MGWGVPLSFRYGLPMDPHSNSRSLRVVVRAAGSRPRETVPARQMCLNTLGRSRHIVAIDSSSSITSNVATRAVVYVRIELYTIAEVTNYSVLIAMGISHACGTLADTYIYYTCMHAGRNFMVLRVQLCAFNFRRPIYYI